MFKFLFKKKNINKDKGNKVQVSGPFNFENYPQLFFGYLDYSNTRSKTYKFSVMDSEGLDVEEKLETAQKKETNKEVSFAKLVFNAFNDIKPILENADIDYKKSNWNEVFKNKTFDELTKTEIKYLVGLIKCNFVYVLPKKFYIKGEERSSTCLQTVSIDYMKSLLENEKK